MAVRTGVKSARNAIGIHPRPQIPRVRSIMNTTVSLVSVVSRHCTCEMLTAKHEVTDVREDVIESQDWCATDPDGEQ